MVTKGTQKLKTHQNGSQVHEQHPWSELFVEMTMLMAVLWPTQHTHAVSHILVGSHSITYCQPWNLMPNPFLSLVSRNMECFCRFISCRKDEGIMGNCSKNGRLPRVLCCRWAWRSETRQPCALRPLMLSADDHSIWASSLSSINCLQCVSCVFAFSWCLLQDLVKTLHVKYQNLWENLCRWMKNLAFTWKILAPNTDNLRKTPDWDTKCKGSPKCSWSWHMPLHGLFLAQWKQLLSISEKVSQRHNG